MVSPLAARPQRIFGRPSQFNDLFAYLETQQEYSELLRKQGVEYEEGYVWGSNAR